MPQGPASGVNEAMRRHWDERAKENAMYYIAFDAAQSEDQFFASGRYDAEKLLRGLPDFDPSKATVLEIGCGMGRLLRALNDRFAALHGVDISSEMVDRGRKLLSNCETIKFHHSPNGDLAMFPDGTFDFVFSYITFQHIPRRKAIENYFDEAYRVLRPGGIFRFQTLLAPSFASYLKNRIRLATGLHKCLYGYVWTLRRLNTSLRHTGFGAAVVSETAGAAENTGIAGFTAHTKGHVWCTLRRP